MKDAGMSWGNNKDKLLIQKVFVNGLGARVRADREFWTQLAYDPKFFSKVTALFRGELSAQTSNHVIDFDTRSTVLNPNFKIHEEDQIASRIRGLWRFDPSVIKTEIPKEQERGTISGADLKKFLEGKLVMGDQLLDFYLENTHLIPKEFREKHVVFWGTIYRSNWGNMIVRYLCCHHKPGNFCCTGVLHSFDSYSDQGVLSDNKFDNDRPAIVAVH